jgi:DNA-binding XRE family transcriptional regulator
MVGGVMIKNKLKEIHMREYMMTSSEFSKMLNINIGTYSQIENNLKLIMQKYISDYNVNMKNMV